MSICVGCFDKRNSSSSNNDDDDDDVLYLMSCFDRFFRYLCLSVFVSVLLVMLVLIYLSRLSAVGWYVSGKTSAVPTAA